MSIIKKYAVLISIILLIIGGLLVYLTNSYDLLSQTVSTVKNNIISNQVIYTLNNKNLLLNILSIILINIGVALFISSHFINPIAQHEKKLSSTKLELF